MDWNQLLQLAAPAIGTAASHGQQGAFYRGFAREQARLDEQARQDAQRDENRKAVGAKASLEILQRLQSMSDPVEFEQLRSLAQTHASDLGMNPDDFAQVQFPESKNAAAQLKAITDALAAVEKGGVDPYDEALAGHSLALPSGQQVSFEQALNLTRPRVVDDSGQMVAPPKPDEKATTDYGRYLAQFAKERGKRTSDLTTTERQQAKKEFEQADDKAPAPIDPQLATLRGLQIEGAKLRNQKLKDGPSDDLSVLNKFKAETKLAQDWSTANKAAQTMEQQYALMQTGLKRFREGDKNGGSQAVLVTFQKILDPTSVVRESEYARSSAGISLLGRIQGFADRLSAGGAGVPDSELSEMVKTAGQFVQQMKQYAAGQKVRISNQAKTYKLDPANIFNEEPPLPGDITGKSGPQVGERRMFNGQVGEWDGAGWKPVTR